ncbi:MAG TPA: hypothetical protein VM935_18110, partial [Chitinophagaceae bacterium]|nr:hypothetical protein [Chitinophagaceae bacterium]
VFLDSCNQACGLSYPVLGSFLFCFMGKFIVKVVQHQVRFLIWPWCEYTIALFRANRFPSRHPPGLYV